MTRRCLILAALMIAGLLSGPSGAKTQTSAAMEPAGQHDFDFLIGTWETHIMYLDHPLAASGTWLEANGRVVVHKIWNGQAILEEFKATDSKDPFESLLLRVYNRQSRQWGCIFANSGGNVLSVHMTGEFKNGRGEFTDREPFNGQTILARTVWSDITPKAHRYELAFSADGGKTWKPNYIATWTRKK